MRTGEFQPSTDAPLPATRGPVITIAGHAIIIPAIQTNYLLRLDFSGTGSLGNSHYSLWLASDDCPALIISEVLSKRTATGCAFLLYLLTGTYDVPATVHGELRGDGWTGAGNSIAATWAALEAV